MRISLLQDTLLRAGTPALPTHRSPFHHKRMIFAHRLPHLLPLTHYLPLHATPVPDLSKARNVSDNPAKSRQHRSQQPLAPAPA